MIFASKTDNDVQNKYFTNIDFGDVPVGSVHKRSIEITNDLKKATRFEVKNNNESMYLADSISFEPSKSQKIFPNKKLNFIIVFSPKSADVQTTLEYYTISSTDDQIEMDEFNENDEFEESPMDIVQKVIVCVHGSCYGPSVKIVPSKVFIYGSGKDEQTIKFVNLVNSSKMAGQYHVQYDWANCPVKCNPSSGVVEQKVQIKLELKPRQIFGYYYKRLYVLIAYQHPVYIDVYAFSDAATTVDPFSYFRLPFELPKYENNYADFFKDIAHPALEKQPVTVFPAQLHFGYVKNTKTQSFDVQNNSDSALCINWIHDCRSNDTFVISPKRFCIDIGKTKTLQCTFQPKTISNIYFAELEATVHFSLSPSLDFDRAVDVLPPYVAPINISIAVTGHSFEKSFNGWRPKCKLNTRVIVMPPSMPASKPVFATFFIKKVVRVPTMFEFRPPNKSYFSVKPKCGLINGDYQIVVFQLLKTSKKESLYAERWSLVFDSFIDNSVNVDIYASVEFGCVEIGEKNHVLFTNDVQVGYEIDAQIPIVNMTRHRLHYCINIYDQLPKSEIKPEPSLSSIYSGYENIETEEMIENEYSNSNYELQSNDEDTVDIKLIEYTNNSITVRNNFTITSTESMQSLDELKFNNWNKENSSNQNQSSFVFKFDKLNGELGPNEKIDLNISFRPLKNVLYTVNAKCYLICNNFPEIVSILPVVLKGNGCRTQLEITPKICNLNDTIVNTEITQRFSITNKSCSYANVNFVTMCSPIYWAIPTCKINPKTFQFTPQQNECKMDLSIYPTKLGFQKFFINVQLESEVESVVENENIITVTMDVITCALQISGIINDSIPYFGKLSLNKLFHCVKVNNKLSKVYTKNESQLIWNVPVISKSTIFEFQLYNSSKIPINLTLKYKECIKCTSNTNVNNIKKVYGTSSNKCVHSKSIRTFPATVNLNIDDFSTFKIELNDIVEDEFKLSYTWSSGIFKSSFYNTELLLEPKTFKDDLISFDPKYGTNEHLEFNFIPIFIAHPNPPAQAFWVYNNNNYNVNYAIIDDSIIHAYPYFHCLNPNGIVKYKSVHPILFVFKPDKLCKFEAIVTLLSNNNRRQITLVGQGESYTRTGVPLGHGLSSFIPIKNNRKIFLSTESIILKPIFTCSNAKFIFCLINNSNEEITYQWKECTVEKILNTIINPCQGNLKEHSSQVFEVSITSYSQPAILTIMFNISYKLVSQNEKYKQSLRNYNINKEKLKGIFLINECGNYKPKLNMKLENEPQEKHLVLYVCVKIIDEFINSKQINKAIYIMKKNAQQEQKIQHSNNFQNILWYVVDNICSKEIEFKPIYYYQLKNAKKNIPKNISKTNKNNLEIILTEMIKNILINIYPLDTWKK